MAFCSVFRRKSNVEQAKKNHFSDFFANLFSTCNGATILTRVGTCRERCYGVVGGIVGGAVGGVVAGGG